MVDAGSEPTYAEKIRVPPPGAVHRFMLEFIEIVILFFMQTHEKETQLGNYV